MMRQRWEYCTLSRYVAPEVVRDDDGKEVDLSDAWQATRRASEDPENHSPIFENAVFQFGLVDTLAELGGKGWELVCSLEHESVNDGGPTLLLKRSRVYE
jgi:hypothetical protein